MDVLDEELLLFWKELNKNGVRYIMIGVIATRFHGYNRTTEDMDIWLEDTITNRQNLRKTFFNLGYGDYEYIETMQFIPGWTTFYAAGIGLDIITEMVGLEEESFDKCLQMASTINLEGILVPFLHINHLIENKKAVNRPKDQVDVIQLEKIKRLRKNNR